MSRGFTKTIPKLESAGTVRAAVLPAALNVGTLHHKVVRQNFTF